MKQFVVSILAILYIGTSSGATLHMHFCMGKLVEMGLWHGKGTKCSNCESKKKATSCNKKCCQDKHKTLQAAKDQKTAAAGFQLTEFTSTATLVNYLELPPILPVAVKQALPPAHAPPRSSKVQLFILNSNFRI